MSFLTSIGRFFSRKASPTQQLIAFHSVGRAQGTPRRYDKFAEEAYLKNVIAFACVDMISKACASIPILLYQKPKSPNGKKQEVLQHPFLELMKRPNPFMNATEFRFANTAYKLLSGNAYVHGIGAKENAVRDFKELYPLRPDRVTIVPGATGYPMAYDYTVGGRKVRIPVDTVSGLSPLLHVRSFHPIHDWYGLANVEPAAMAIDQHNESGVWNLSLLQKSATPSGVLTADVSAVNPQGAIGEEQRARLKEEIDAFFAGARNSGRPMLLEGGLKWQQTGLNPKDMDWTDGKAVAAREISLGFGVPSMLLNIPGDNTYANYKEAREAFYEGTIIPLLGQFVEAWNHWLLPALDETPGLCAEADHDAIEALAPKREALWNQTKEADFLTINEKRERLGFDPIDGGDELLVSSAQVPLTYAVEDPAPSEQPIPGQDPSETDPPVDPGQEDPADPAAAAGKVFNLKGKRAKAQEWRESNRIRMRFEKRLARALASVFQSEGEAVVEAVGKARNAAEALDRAAAGISAHRFKFRSVLRAHLNTAGVEFGKRVLRSLKSARAAPEVKDSSIRFRIHFQEWVDRHAVAQVDDISETTKKKVRKAIEDWQETGDPLDKLTEKLQDTYEGFSDSRAETIARTEVHTASNRASLEAASATEIPNLRKEWIFTADSRTRPEHRLSSRDSIVDMNEKFTVDGEELDAPGDPAGSPGNIINCRCTVAFLVEGEE